MADIAKTPAASGGLRLPRVVYGSSTLGNLFQAMSEERASAIVRAWTERSDQAGPPVTIDSAGKYGAGLALERIGSHLRRLGVAAGDVQISNKLGWYRVPLRAAEPTFEPGAWVGLEHDAELRISRQGILDCWEQGCELLGDPFRPQLVSVHDPDEYLAMANGGDERVKLERDLFDAYESLAELKSRGEVTAVGVGAKDWRVCKLVADKTPLDWVMIANSLTFYSHPAELIDWIAQLAERGVMVINSAVFNAGFLVGGDFFNYRKIDPSDAADQERLAWRERFQTLCDRHGVKPAAACVRFGLAPDGVAAVALSTSNPERIPEFDRLASEPLPEAFWREASESGLIAANLSAPRP